MSRPLRVADRASGSAGSAHLFGLDHAIGLLAFAGAILTVVDWLRRAATWHGIEVVESHVLSLVLWWRQGVLPYRGFDELPLLHNPYGPVYLWVAHLLPTDAASPYGAARAVSMVAAAACIGLVVIWVRGRGGTLWAGGLAACLLLTTKPWLLFAALCRVDAFGLAWSVAGFLLLTGGARPAGRWRTVLGVVALVVAFNTKLTLIAAPAAVLLVEARRDRRRAALLAALLAGAFAGSVAVMEAVSNGAYLANARFGVDGSLAKSLDLLARLGLSVLWLAAIAVADRDGRVLRSSPASRYLLTSVGTLAVFGVNPLSSWNYLLEVYVALALLSGEVLAAIERQRVAAGRARIARRLLLAHVALALLLTAGWVVERQGQLDGYAQCVVRAHDRLTAERARHGTPAGGLAVVGAAAGWDALNGLGEANPIAIPAAFAGRPEIARVLAQAPAASVLVLQAVDFARCAGRSPAADPEGTAHGIRWWGVGEGTERSIASLHGDVPSIPASGPPPSNR